MYGRGFHAESYSHCLCVCLQAVSDAAPTSLHLSDCSRGACIFQCSIHKRAEASRQPTQTLRVQTKGHPPTPCCPNDSPDHAIMRRRIKKPRRIMNSTISGGWEVLRETLVGVSLELLITALRSWFYRAEGVKGRELVCAFRRPEHRKATLSNSVAPVKVTRG